MYLCIHTCVRKQVHTRVFIMKHWLLFAFYYLLSLSIYAAQSRTDFDVKKLGLREGLSSNYILDIKQDKWGFMWFATEQGLNRFDGSRFISYYKSPGQLTDNNIRSLLDDPKRPILWIGTRDRGLNAFNYATNTFKNYRHNNQDRYSLIANEITYLTRAYDGNMWITTYNSGLDHFNYKTGKFTHYNSKNVKGLPDDDLWCALDLGDGLILVGHIHHGLTLINTHTRKAKNYRANSIQPSSLMSDEVNSLYQDPFGNIWVGTSKGLCLYDFATDKITPIHHPQIDGHRIFTIGISENYRIMVSVEQNGIILLNSPHELSQKDVFHFNQITAGDTQHSLVSNFVRTFYEDSHHNLWIGHYGSGVNFITNSLPPIHKLRYGANSDEFLSARSVLSLVVDNQNHLFVGTGGYGVAEFSPDLHRIAEYSMNNGAIQAAYKDKSGNLWFGSYLNGAYVRKGSQMTHILNNEDVRCFQEDPLGRIRIGTATGVIIVDKNTLKVIRSIKREGFMVTSIVFDKKGNAWENVLGDGIYVYSPNEKLVKRFSSRTGFPTNTAAHLMQDRDGYIWAATDEGLVRFDNQFVKGKYKLYTTKDGLKSNFIRAVIQNRDGDIWVSTAKGLSCLRKGKFINFGYNDNVLVGDFVAGGVAQGLNNNIYFGTTEAGINYFNPKDIFSRRKELKAYITGLHLYHNNGNEIEDSVVNLIGKKELRVESDQNTLDIDLNIQEYEYRHCVEYCYKLEGVDKDWYYTSKNRAILYKVPYGTHNLLVKCHLRNQPWPKKYTAFKLIIAAPWYFTWWMKMLYIFVFIGVIFVIVRTIIRHIQLKYLLESEKKNLANEQALSEERIRFYTNITHELRTPLTLILSPLEDISKRTDLPVSVNHQLSLIHQNAQHLNNLITSILEFRKSVNKTRELLISHDNIVDYIHECIIKYQELNRKKEVEIRFFAQEPHIEMYFDKDAIGMIVDNLVTNSIKYTERGSIDVSVERRRLLNKHLVDITISDTGHGISQKAQEHIYERFYQERGKHQASGTGIGLALVKQLVELHQGTIQLKSSLEQGTSFVVSLDEENVYPKAKRSNQHTPIAANTKELSTGNNQAADEKPIMLVVEDNHDILEYVTASFAQHFTVKQAQNGQEGLAIALETIPDIIISDIMMPKMDGNMMCRTLKEDMRTCHIPIILLTAKDSNDAKVEGYEAGADSYITKPFTHAILESRVNNLLQQRKRMASVILESQTETVLKYGNRRTTPPKTFKSETVGQAFMLLSALTAAKKDGKTSVNSDSIDFLKTDENPQYTAITTANETVRLNTTDKKFLDKVNQYIQDNIRNNLDVNMIADHVAMSGSSLYRKMKALTGLSTNEYIRKYRMHYAEQLMMENKYSINEISFMVGINSIAYFRKSFKAEFGDLPTDYMKKKGLL